MHSHVLGQVVAHAFKEAKHLKPVRPGKSACVGFIVGVLFGPIGTGVYLGRWVDFFVPLALIVIRSVMTIGLAAPVCWLLCGLWGATRATTSRSPDA